MSEEQWVYVVTSGAYSDYHIEAVFTNLEAAEAAVREANKGVGSSEPYASWDMWDIEPYLANRVPVDGESGPAWFAVVMSLVSDAQVCEEATYLPLAEDRAPHIIKKWRWGSRPVGPALRLYIRARDRQQALKSATEMKAQLIATEAIDGLPEVKR